MPVLGGLIVSLFGGLASFFVRFIGVRLAAIDAAVGTWGALTVALYTAAGAVSATLSATFPPFIMTGVWLFVPDNAVACVSAAMMCDTLVALYRWNTGTLRLAAAVS